MAERSKSHKSPSWGLLSNDRYLSKRAMVPAAPARGKRQHEMILTGTKHKRTNAEHKPSDTHKLVKRRKFSDVHQSLNCDSKSMNASEYQLLSNQLSTPDSWEVDSGFCSEASLPPSGRSSPYPSPTMVVALDCEMVGTGPGGRCSELARCSIVDYYSNVLYDKYVRPCQPVTNFRTRWSGIQRHHLHNATPFTQAREEVVRILEGKVVVGHSVDNDFEALDLLHPGHMVRDTSCTRLLNRLAGFPPERCASLKILASRLLNRKIQGGRRGHCSVEDACSSLDLYKLVEGEWERHLQDELRGDDGPPQPSYASSNHYMHDEYWPEDVIADDQ